VSGVGEKRVASGKLQVIKAGARDCGSGNLEFGLMKRIKELTTVDATSESSRTDLTVDPHREDTETLRKYRELGFCIDEGRPESTLGTSRSRRTEFLVTTTVISDK
jgi:hypothetical protein